MPTLAVDLDGTLACFFEHALERINQRFGTTYRMEHATAWDASEWMPAEHAAEVWTCAADVRIYERLDCYPEAVAAVRRLHACGYPIVIATHRPEPARPYTERWLATQRIPYQELLCSPQAKLELAGRAKPDAPIYFIDDDPHLARRLSLPSPGVRLFLLERAYTGPSPEGVDLVANLEAVERMLGPELRLDLVG